METLKFLLKSKKADLETPYEVVREAVDWMSTQFRNAEISFEYIGFGVGLGSYGYFQIRSSLKGTAVTLHLKIAEINATPYAFAEVRVRGKEEVILFPFFGEIGTLEGKLTILHYIADFIISSTPELASEKAKA